MSLYSITFYLFGFLAGIGALALAFSKNVFYSAVYVMICLLSLAGIYVLAFAEFVAVTQILVYAGGVMVVIVFGIMLTAKLGTKPLEVKHTNVFTALIVSVPLFIVLCLFIYEQPFVLNEVSPIEENPKAIERIGINLMTEYVLAFEVAGILLLITLIGAAVIASHKIKEV
jgi:NADH:ubiquinone oxidoreductase subunit 6 (subunit J)